MKLPSTAGQTVPLSASSLLTSRTEIVERATASSSSSRSLHTPTTSPPYHQATQLINPYNGFNVSSAPPPAFNYLAQSVSQPQAFANPVILTPGVVAVPPPHVNSPPAINAAGVGRDRPTFTRTPNPHAGRLPLSHASIPPSSCLTIFRFPQSPRSSRQYTLDPKDENNKFQMHMSRYTTTLGTPPFISAPTVLVF